MAIYRLVCLFDNKADETTFIPAGENGVAIKRAESALNQLDDSSQKQFRSAKLFPKDGESPVKSWVGV